MCLNPELKVEGLKDSHFTLEWLLSLIDEELQDFEKCLSTNHLITYKEWQLQPVTKKKISQNTTEQNKEINVQAKPYRIARNVVTETSKKFLRKLLIEVEELKEHNARKISQFRRIREVRSIVNDRSNKAAAIRMDRSENAKLFQCRQEKVHIIMTYKSL